MRPVKILAASLVLSALLSGCSPGAMADVYDDDERIAGESNSYTIVRSKQFTENGQHWTASVGKMEGMDTIWTYEAEEATDVDITYTLSVSSGKLKLVWITPDGTLSIIAECDSAMEEPAQSTLHLENGTHRIKLVASEDTGFDADITLSKGEIKGVG